jgi:DNA-binding GntR family transcriptional regulator
MRQMQGGTDLGIQARIWELLSRSEEDLTDEQISSRIPRASSASLREALYRMVREGTIVLTPERKYRVTTVD